MRDDLHTLYQILCKNTTPQTEKVFSRLRLQGCRDFCLKTSKIFKVQAVYKLTIIIIFSASGGSYKHYAQVFAQVEVLALAQIPLK